MPTRAVGTQEDDESDHMPHQRVREEQNRTMGVCGDSEFVTCVRGQAKSRRARQPTFDTRLDPMDSPPSRTTQLRAPKKT